MQLFSPHSGDLLLDATIGHGGHAKAYLEATNPDGTVIGLDADPAALIVARQNLAKYGARVQVLNVNFTHLNDALKRGGMVESGDSTFHNVPPRHILFDLGLGSHQLADPTRGFSFLAGSSITMAYGPLSVLPPAQVPALNALEKHLGFLPDVSEILSGLTTPDLAELIRVYGEERYAERVAQAIKHSLPIETALELARVIADAMPGRTRPPKPWRRRIHPATRTFQALRLAVNRELESLAVALPQALGLLKPGGVVAVISFHSLEDRLVKQFFRAHKGTGEILTKKPIQATEAEIRRNPRSRSAKLRAARKT